MLRRTCQDHLFLCRGIDKLAAGGPSSSLLNVYISLRHNAFQLACPLIFRLAAFSQKQHLDALRRDGGLLRPNQHLAAEDRFTLGIDVGELVRGHIDRRQLALFVFFTKTDATCPLWLPWANRLR